MRSTSLLSIGVAIATVTGSTEAFYWKDRVMRVFEGKVFAVEQRDGMDVVVHGPAATIVAVDTRDRVTLVRQERVPAGRVVRGFFDGDLPIRAARLQRVSCFGCASCCGATTATRWSDPAEKNSLLRWQRTSRHYHYQGR